VPSRTVVPSGRYAVPDSADSTPKSLLKRDRNAASTTADSASVDLRQGQPHHQLFLERAEQALDPPLGLRRLGGARGDPEPGQHPPDLEGLPLPG
jgi:hypothetical protein